jgi:Osmosensitive K+ channel histidine kinase
MLAEANVLQLCHIAECIRTLCGCDGACIVLHCFDDDLCPTRWQHLLLPQLTPSPCLALPRYYGTITDTQLLKHERILAYCDMALQTGDLWLLNATALATFECADTSLESPIHNTTAFIAIAPLTGTAGMPGWLFCTATAEHVLGESELRCLQQCLPRISHLVESALTDESPYAAPYKAQRVSGKTTPEAELSYDELLSLIGHDLRTPLSVIKGYAGLLQTYGFTEAQIGLSEPSVPGVEGMTSACRQKYFHAIMEQIEHLEVLIGDLLDISRLRSGRISLNPVWLALGELCQEIAQQMQDRMEQQEAGRYCIRCQPDPALPFVLADRHRVQQVVTNLLENAIKYSPAGGLIEIFIHTEPALYVYTGCVDQERMQSLCPQHAVSSTTAMVAVTIRDYGIGIPQRQQAALFQPFKRLAPVTAAIPGSGLGLYISRRLLEAMHGRIVLSSHEGNGTSVTFMLPAVPVLHERSGSDDPFNLSSSSHPYCAQWDYVS